MAQPRVLVADDDDKIRELLELYLTPTSCWPDSVIKP